MSFKDLLLQLSSYPKASSPMAIDEAVALAELLGARISALTFEIEFHVRSNPLAIAVLDVPAMVVEEKAKCVASARSLVNAFGAAAAKRAVPSEHIIERCDTAHIPDVVTEHARVRDLTIIPVEEPPGSQQHVAERVVFGSGRPIVILPAELQPNRPVRLDNVGIAWDFSRPAARAVGDAIPLLQRAKTVRVITVTKEKAIETGRRASDLARHLGVHGVEVILEQEDAGDRAIGDVLSAYATGRELDLLIMGAFGHSRIRDFILGGATRSMVNNPPLPVFLSH